MEINVRACVRARARARVCVCVCVCVNGKVLLRIPEGTGTTWNVDLIHSA